MATEFEELKLTVNLTDQASAMIAKMRNDLANISSGANVDHIKRTHDHIHGSTLALRGVAQATGVNITSLINLKTSLSIALIGPSTVLALLEGMHKAGSAFADALEDVWKVSQITGASVAQLESWMKEAEKAGGDSSTVARMAQDARNAASDIMRERSELVNALKKEGRHDPLGTKEMIEKLRTLAQTDFPAFQLELMQRVENVTENARKEGKNEALVQRDRERAMKMFGIDPLMQRLFKEGKLKLPTQEEKEKWEQRPANMKKFLEYSRVIGTSIRELKEKFLSVATNPNLPLYKTLKWALEQATALAIWAKGIGRVISAGTPEEQYEKWKRENPNSDFLKPPSPQYRFMGDGGEVTIDQNEQIAALSHQFKILNDWLDVPENLKFFFHNRPMGGARGESNPIKKPAGIAQPGGGAAVEAEDKFAKPTSNDVTALQFAQQHLGTHEIANKAVLEKFFRDSGFPLAASSAWCAVYANSVLKSTGHDVSAGIDAKVSGAAAGSFLTNPDYKKATFEDVESGYGTYVGVLKGASPRTHIEGVHIGILTGESRINPKTGKMEYRMRGGNQPESDENTGERTSGEGRVVSDIWYEADKLHLRSVPRSAAELGTIGIKDGKIQGLDAGDGGGGGDGIGGPDLIKSQGKQAQEALADVNRSLREQAEGSDPRRMQRALEGVAPGSDEEWELRRQRALTSDAGYYGNEKTRDFFSQEHMNPQVPEGYGPGVGLPGMGEIEKTIREGGRRHGKTDEDVRLSEEYYSDPKWRTKRVDEWEGGQPISFDRSELSRTDPNRIEMDGSLDVEVDAPRGTTVDAEGDGAFKGNTQINRTMPLDEANV